MDEINFSQSDLAALERMWVEERQKILTEAERRFKSYLGGAYVGGKLAASRISGTVPLANFPGILVEESDGTPSVSSVKAIIVSNGTLTDDGAGTVTLTTSASGGDVTLIDDHTVTGSAEGTVTFSSISGTYKHLQVVVSGAATGGSGNGYVLMEIGNGVAASSHYSNLGQLWSSGTGSNGLAGSNQGQIGWFWDNTSPDAGGVCVVWIPDYAGTVYNKTYSATGFFGFNVTSPDQRQTIASGMLHGTGAAGAITSLTLTIANGYSFTVGTRASLYGFN